MSSGNTWETIWRSKRHGCSIQPYHKILFRFTQQLLGSLDQAKSVLFYLISYEGKTKFDFKQCLTIMNEALKHVKEHKSKSIKGDVRTVRKTTMHFLQQVLNRSKLNTFLSLYFSLLIIKTKLVFALITQHLKSLTKWWSTQNLGCVRQLFLIYFVLLYWKNDCGLLNSREMSRLINTECRGNIAR